MVVLRRPSTFDEGVEQLRTALEETAPPVDGATPRAKLWRAAHTLFHDPGFVDALRLLHGANEIVSFLFNTIVPHIEERLRYDTLQEEYDRAHGKPHAVKQNGERLRAIVDALVAAEEESRRERSQDAQFVGMREGMRTIHTNETVLTGLSILYVSSKTARSALDLILKRLLDTYRNDSTIVRTTDIPFEAMLLR